METTFSPYRDIDIFPVNTVDDRVYISPEATIELVINRFRKSLYPDEEIAKHICELLGFIMEKNHLIIAQKNMKDSDAKRFHILRFEKAQD